MAYATKQDVQEVVDRAVDQISFVIQDFAKQVDERFNKVEASLDKLTNTIDGFLKRLDDIEIENTARDAHMARLDRWVHEIATKPVLNSKLS